MSARPRLAEEFRLFVAPHTPCRPGGALDTAAVPRLAAHFAREGLTGVFVGGTTGEGLSFDRDERRALTAAWTAAGRRHGLQVLVHVGAHALGDAFDLAAHAAEQGADAIAALAPTFFKPATPAALVDWFAAIAEAAPRTPFYFYDLPALTGVRLPTAEVLALATARLPDFRGVKFTNPDLAELQRCLQCAEPEQEILYGNDESLIAAARLGCTGAVGSTYAFAAPIARRALRALDAGDEETARQWQRRLIAVVDVLAARGYLPSAKALSAMLGLDVGPVRAPLRPLDARATAELQRELQELGLQAWLGEAAR